MQTHYAMRITALKDSLCMCSEMQFIEWVLKSAENYCILPECENVEGLSYAVSDNINDTRSSSKYFPCIQQQHFQEKFSYNYQLFMSCFIFLPLFCFSADTFLLLFLYPLILFKLSFWPSPFYQHFILVSLDSISLFAQRAFIVNQKGRRRMRRGFL